MSTKDERRLSSKDSVPPVQNVKLQIRQGFGEVLARSRAKFINDGHPAWERGRLGRLAEQSAKSTCLVSHTTWATTWATGRTACRVDFSPVSRELGDKPNALDRPGWLDRRGRPAIRLGRPAIRLGNVMWPNCPNLATERASVPRDWGDWPNHLPSRLFACPARLGRLAVQPNFPNLATECAPVLRDLRDWPNDLPT